MSRRTRNLALILASATTVTAVGLAVEQTAFGGGESALSEPPPLVSVVVQAGSGEDPVGFTFAPPLNSSPVVSADQAASTAWETEGVPGEPSSTKAVLESVTWEPFGLVLRDVWAVIYPDACQPLFRPNRPPAPGEPDCFVQPFTTFIDATTGQYLVSFAAGNS